MRPFFQDVKSTINYKETRVLTQQQRFISKFTERDPDSCWNWDGAKVEGYGYLWVIGNHLIRAHRYAWQLANGDIPEGKLVLHKCDNRSCVNPSHLYLGDHSDNMKDWASRHIHIRTLMKLNP